MRRLGTLALLALLLAACSTTPPRAYTVGEPIPLGPYTVSVAHTDTRNVGGLGLLSVHFRLRGSTSPRDVIRFMDKFVDAFSARDSNGNTYRGFPAPDASPKTSRVSTDIQMWTAVFSVPANARGFTLYVENRMRQTGQPSVASVALER